MDLKGSGGVLPTPVATTEANRPRPAARTKSAEIAEIVPPGKPVGAAASVMIMAAFGNTSEAELETLFSQVAWYQKPSFSDFQGRVTEAKKAGFAVDRGAMFQGITLVSVPVLSPSWEPLLILTAAGHSHDLDAEALEPLCRAMQSAAARLSESVRLLRLE